MSMLLKMLMEQEESSDKPNLAVITDATTQINTLNNRLLIPCGVSANTLPNHKYHFIFDLEGELLESRLYSNNQILSKWPNNFFTPQNWGMYFQGQTPQKFAKHYDIHVEGVKTADGTKTEIIQYDSNGFRGWVRIYNLEVYEE